MTRGMLMALLACAGCMVETEDVAGSGGELRQCYPSGNRYNCRPANDCPDFRRVCEPRRDWPIRPGTELVDGLGGPMGTIADGTVRVNYGIRKELDGRTFVYVWSASITEGGRRSGWIDESAFVHARELRAAMGSSRHRDPGQGDYETLRIVTGGDTARYAALKIQPNESRSGRNATDYLLRPGNVVNLLYSVPGRGLGGHAIDTVPTGVVFHRARGVSQITVPLYRAGGSRRVDALHFVYGWIHDGRQRRYGWIAEEAMEHARSGSRDDLLDNCYVRCNDGSLHQSRQPDAASCRAWYHVCADRGHVARMQFDGVYIYDASWESG